MNEHVVRWLKASADPRAVVARALGTRATAEELDSILWYIRKGRSWRKGNRARSRTVKR